MLFSGLFRVSSDVTPERTSIVLQPPSFPNRMSVSNLYSQKKTGVRDISATRYAITNHFKTYLSPTMQIWLRSIPNSLHMYSSMNIDGLPTTVGSTFVEPLIHPTIEPFPAHSWAAVRWVTASVLVAMKRQSGFSRMQRVEYWIL